MRLAQLLHQAGTLEERAAALYRRFATEQFDEPALAALWTALAADEDAHARSIRDAQSQLTAAERELSAVAGCEAALTDIAQRVRQAEALDPDATLDRRLSAAIEIELSELESLRQLALHASSISGTPPMDHSHVHRLTDAARQYSRDGHVRLAAALLLARERLAAFTAVSGRPPACPSR